MQHPRLPYSLLLASLTACSVPPNADSTPAQAASNTSAGTTAKPPTPSAGASAPPSISRRPSAAGSSATTAAAGKASNTPKAGSAANSGNAGSAGTPAAGSGGSSAGTAGTTGTAGTPAANGCQGTLCESFEADALDPSWEISTSNCMGTGKVSVDSMQAHSGTHSIRVDGGAGFCNHVFFRPKPSTWMPAAPLYARFFVRIEKPLTQSHVTFLALHDEAEMKDVRMGGQSEILMWNRESDDATLPELSPTGIAMSVKPATSKWLCIEIAIDSQAPKLETWLDGEPVKGLTVEGDPTPDVDAQWQRKANWHPMLSDIRFGWESYGGDENTLWFDDVVLGTTRTGCGS